MYGATVECTNLSYFISHPLTEVSLAWEDADVCKSYANYPLEPNARGPFNSGAGQGGGSAVWLLSWGPEEPTCSASDEEDGGWGRRKFQERCSVLPAFSPLQLLPFWPSSFLTETAEEREREIRTDLPRWRLQDLGLGWVSRGHGRDSKDQPPSPMNIPLTGPAPLACLHLAPTPEA